MNSYISVPTASFAAVDVSSAGYVSTTNQRRSVVGSYVGTSATTAVVGSYIDSDLGASAFDTSRYELAS
ncbi:hypothetical protein [Leifsonia sp. A12D58]|uniref:hypothetical protein n=1 Tax=Leifsonia sp. A12D58 TaxID=3397674 RepID=UPI0039E04A73